MKCDQPLRRTHPAGNLAGLNRWIAAWASESAEPAGRIRRRVAMMVLAAMLDTVRDDSGSHRYAVKGGSALELRYGSKARVSRDIDLLFRGALHEVHELLREAVETGWSGFAGRVLDPVPLNIPWGDVTGQRIEAKLTYQGKPFTTLVIEVVTAISPALELVTSLSLARLGLEPPVVVPCLNLPYQVAEKLHACSDALDGERTNDRASDLMDLILMENLSLSEDARREARTACVEVFMRRDRQPWPPVLIVQSTWPRLWTRIVENNGFYVRRLDDAVAKVNALIHVIDRAT